MTTINYVRNLSGGGVGAAHFRQALPPTGAAARVHRSQALRSLRSLQCGLLRSTEISGCPDAYCYKRRQSEVYFVWITGPLLQTSSIRWLFR